MGGNNNNNFEQFAIKMYTHVVAYFYLYASIMSKMCLVPTYFQFQTAIFEKKDE